MKIVKIVGYIAVAAVAIAVVAFLKDGFLAFAISFVGFYFISKQKNV